MRDKSTNRQIHKWSRDKSTNGQETNPQMAKRQIYQWRRDKYTNGEETNPPMDKRKIHKWKRNTTVTLFLSFDLTFIFIRCW